MAGFSYPCQMGEQVNINRLEWSFHLFQENRVAYLEQRVKYIPPKPLPSIGLPFAISVPPAATAAESALSR